MTEIISPSNIIRSELVDIAIGFLKNPTISGEKLERKREFLQKKGLTDTEINYAFELIPQPETTKQISTNHRSSFLRRILNNLVFAGFLALAIRIIKNFFQSNKNNELNETIKTLQKSVENIQTSIIKLEQTANQLNSTIQPLNPNRSSAIEDIKQEIQGLKGLFLNRSQFPQIPSYQSKAPKTSTTSDNDNDGIIVISEQDKKSDDE